MAKVTELKFGSREGSTWSMYEPSSGTVRVFTVVVDNQNDDPRYTLRTTPLDGPKGQLVNEGSRHPWDDGLYARDFSIIGRINNVTWTVSVYYAQRELTVGTWNGWIPRVTTSSAFVRRDESIPWYPWDDFPPIYVGQAVIYANSGLREGVKTVASLRYTPCAEAVATHRSISADGKDVWLKQTASRDMTREVGFDWEQPIVILTMDKDILTAPRGYAMLLAYYKNRVNSQRFLPHYMNAPTGHCKFVNGDVSIVSGKPPGSVNAGMYYHVQLVFVLSGEPMSFIRRTHFFEHEGAIHPVIRKDSGKKQQEDFKAAMQTDLNTLVNVWV